VTRSGVVKLSGGGGGGRKRFGLLGDAMVSYLTAMDENIRWIYISKVDIVEVVSRGKRLEVILAKLAINFKIVTRLPMLTPLNPCSLSSSSPTHIATHPAPRVS